MSSSPKIHAAAVVAALARTGRVWRDRDRVIPRSAPGDGVTRHEVAALDVAGVDRAGRGRCRTRRRSPGPRRCMPSPAEPLRPRSSSCARSATKPIRSRSCGPRARRRDSRKLARASSPRSASCAQVAFAIAGAAGAPPSRRCSASSRAKRARRRERARTRDFQRRTAGEIAIDRAAVEAVEGVAGDEPREPSARDRGPGVVARCARGVARPRGARRHARGHRVRGRGGPARTRPRRSGPRLRCA